MNLRAVAWGVAFAASGAVVAAGLVPGSAGWAAGPRVGVGMTLLMLGGLMVAVPVTGFLIRRSARREDAAGGCPVGATCACGHFNFKPRRACRQCGAATSYAPAAR